MEVIHAEKLLVSFKLKGQFNYIQTYSMRLDSRKV